MTKFDLKKIIAENKATFFSSLDEDKKEYYKNAEADDAEHIEALEKDMKADKKLSEVLRSKEAIIKTLSGYYEIDPKEFEGFKLDGTDEDTKKVINFVASQETPFTFDQIQDDIEKLINSTGPTSDEVYPYGYGRGGYGRSYENKETTMTKEALKAKIKEMILAELNEEDGPAVTDSNYSFYNESKIAEAKKEDEEATDAPEATDVEVSAEETPTSDNFEVSTSEVDPTIKAIQDALTQAQAAAQKLGDEKLTDQIGNTITFFTRTHVANKDVAPVAEELDEAFINKMKHRAGIIK